MPRKADVDTIIIDTKFKNYCLADAIKNLEKIRTTTADELSKCVKEGLEQFIRIYSFTHRLTKIGNKIINELNEIKFSCMLQISNEVACIVSEKRKAIHRVKHFNVKYKRRYFHRRRANTKVKDQVLVCFGNKLEEAKTKIVNSVFSSQACISTAVKEHEIVGKR
ncbi:hypothetical protein KM043_018588 [Ampulex compressa]|nr:hypothetical protein KM043_018588 [Ampulex compressa]